MLKILADENIPFAQEAFGTLGEVQVLPGRAIKSEVLRDVEVLLVRSITAVNAGLLRGTAVRFLGTATIGIDHIDLNYLQAHNIAFASAVGSNANSVAEYVTAALLHWAVSCRIDLPGKILGVVGAGHVGSLVIQKARALGLQVLVDDPPLARKIRSERSVPPWDFCSLDELMPADMVTVHTPLLHDGSDPTFHLFDETRLRAMKRGSILINTARGAVVDNQALKKVLQAQHLSGAILDVWEHEPCPDLELLRRVNVATPHIAGYSFDGKLQGTLQIYVALCRFLGVPPTWDATSCLPAPAQPVIESDRRHDRAAEVLHGIVRQAYNLAADDQALRDGLYRSDWGDEHRGRHFDDLRRSYPPRREFGNYRVQLHQSQLHLGASLLELGFQIYA
ncbi:MAG: 4-phosphoerythronate dehydrogenase [bacterium]